MECAQLRFSWQLHFRNDAKIGSSPKARKALCRVLGEMEMGVTDSQPLRTLPLSAEARALGISMMIPDPKGVAGKVNLFPGWTSNELSAPAVPQWISSLFQDEAQQDNVRKLQNSGPDENHMFWIARDGVPTTIAFLLQDPEKNLPHEAPTAPDGVTDVWLVGGLACKRP